MVALSVRPSRRAGLATYFAPDPTTVVILLSVAAALGALAFIGLPAAACTFATALALFSRLAGSSALLPPAMTILVILLSVAASLAAFAVIGFGAAVCTFASALAPTGC